MSTERKGTCALPLWCLNVFRRHIPNDISTESHEDVYDTSGAKRNHGVLIPDDTSTETHGDVYDTSRVNRNHRVPISNGISTESHGDVYDTSGAKKNHRVPTSNDTCIERRRNQYAKACFYIYAGGEWWKAQRENP